MEGDDGQTCPWARPFWDIAQEGVDGVELFVDGDANGLKDARSGMWVSGSWVSEDGATDVGQLSRRRQLPVRRAFADASRECARLPDIRILVEDIGQGGGRCGLQERGGGLS